MRSGPFLGGWLAFRAISGAEGGSDLSPPARAAADFRSLRPRLPAELGSPEVPWFGAAGGR